jgi:hypothetical protein
VAAQRRARERAEERLEATAHDIEAVSDSSHATRLLVDSQRACRDRGGGWLTSSWGRTASRWIGASGGVEGCDDGDIWLRSE